MDSIKDPLLTTLQLDWDTNGSILHRFEDVSSLSFSQKQSLLAMSVPVLISSQIGSFSANRSLALCHHLLNFLSRGEIVVEPINSALAGACVKFHQKGETIYPLFFPSKSETGEDANIQDGVRQMIINYVWHVNNTVSEELSQKMRDVTLIALHFYLTEGLPLVAEKPGFNANKIYTAVHEKTVGLSFYFPKEWRNGGFHTRKRFDEIMVQTKNAYERFQKAMFKPRSLDGMSELEKLKFVTEELLPAMQEEALKQLEEKEAVKKQTMAYVEQAINERNRNITTRKVIIAVLALGLALFALIAAAVMCYVFQLGVFR